MLTFLLVLARMAGLVSAQRLTAITDGLTRLRTRGHFALGERIRLTIGDRPIRVNRDHDLPVTVSVGAVSRSGLPVDPERLVRAADQALYAAKREGRNLVRSLAPVQAHRFPGVRSAGTVDAT
jgi:GGDEF domain-containing protein